MRETLRDVMLMLAEKFYYLAENFYRRANQHRSH